MIRISKKQVIAYHAYLIERFGGMPGIRDEGMLDSALSAAFSTFDGELLYPDPRQRAAKLVQGLICNHPFNDGNKRIGVGVMGIYLKAEGLRLHATNDELIEFGLHVATNSSLELIIAWVREHATEG